MEADMLEQKVIQSFRDAKIGLFLHWGLYAIPAKGEWAIYREEISKEKYSKYKRMFNPVRFDADEWVDMAKKAGMNYICITTKHHDGFCLFDSKYTDWKITNTPFGRDVIKELAEACRKKDMLFGIYYSIWDLWQEGLDGGYNEMDIQGELKAISHSWTPSKEGVDYMHNQVEELCNNYGHIDYFFFDVKRAPGEAYRGTELIEKMRQWQPEMIINDRLGVPADCKSPENVIPDEPIVDDNGDLLLWESNMCSNKNWGYVHDDVCYKTPDEVIRELVETVAKGGNFLINVGPNALGEFPKENVDMLKQVGQWMDYHKEAIYGCELYPLGKGANHFRWRGLCATTNKSCDTVYIHIPNYPASGTVDNKVVIPKFDRRTIDYMVLLEDGTEVDYMDYGYYGRGKNAMTLLLPRRPGHSAVTTVAIKFKA